VVRNGGGGDAAQRHDFAAVHFFSGADGLKNQKASLVGQGFGNFLDARAVHGSDQFSEVSLAKIVGAQKPEPFPQEDATRYLDVHLSIEDSKKAEDPEIQLLSRKCRTFRETNSD
jgi:hypothetical protein